MKLTKLPRETLAEQAARNLLAFIETQGLKPGNLLPPEMQLATDLGVSRPIIREALKWLEGKGVIDIVSGKGAMVRPITGETLELFFRRAMQIERETIVDLIELRSLVEVQSASLAAQRRTNEELIELERIVGAMRSNLHVPEAYVELDVVFHQHIAAMTHNAMIRYLVSALRKSLNQTLRESMLRPLAGDHLERVQVGHEAILHCIEARDSAAAERAMAAHFDEAVASLVHGTLGRLAADDEHTQSAAD